MNKVQRFKYGNFKLDYPAVYYQFLKEQFIFDIYRSNLLKKGEYVLDLGSNIGAFSILASKLVGENGRVISVEPNKNDYDLLVNNIKLNGCSNVTPVNVGVGGKNEIRNITFWRGTFECILKPLTEILNDLNLFTKFHFIKMDIEGSEIEAINFSLEIFRNANIVSVECHNNKKKVDELLFPLGYRFYPINTSYVLKNMVKNSLTHPWQTLRAIGHTFSENPRLIYRVLRGYDMNKEHADNIMIGEINSVVGSYIKNNSIKDNV
jgi:FkbM family methyltransferase